MTNERYLTVAEAAERLRVTQETVKRWLRSGRLRGSRPGGTKAGWRIPASAVEAILDGE